MLINGDNAVTSYFCQRLSRRIRADNPLGYNRPSPALGAGTVEHIGLKPGWILAIVRGYRPPCDCQGLSLRGGLGLWAIVQPLAATGDDSDARTDDQGPCRIHMLNAKLTDDEDRANNARIGT
jgi:hypothetical protein